MDMTFFRAALLGACVLLSGCDSATTPATPTATATVLDGKTMGTFWRVSVIGVDEAKARRCAPRFRPSWTPTIACCRAWKNDSALMRFDHAAATEPWPVSEAMADIVSPVAADRRQNARRDGYYRGAAGQPVGLWPG